MSLGTVMMHMHGAQIEASKGLVCIERLARPRQHPTNDTSQTSWLVTNTHEVPVAMCSCLRLRYRQSVFSLRPNMFAERCASRVANIGRAWRGGRDLVGGPRLA